MNLLPIHRLPESGRERGQSLTELALMVPLLLLVLLGTVDLGRVYNAYVSIANASREGARAATNNPLDTDHITNAVRREVTNSGLVQASVSVTVECAAFGSSSFSAGGCSSLPAGSQVRVTVGYPFQFITTYIFGIGTLNINEFTIMAMTQ